MTPPRSRTCTKCGETKPLSEFYKQETCKYGRRPDCKECVRKRSRAYMRSPRGSAQRAQYEQTDAYKEAKARAKRRHRRRHPQRLRARSAVWHAVANGDLPPASECDCVECDGPAEHYHHHNGYDREHQLDVVPVCRDCHQELG